MLLVGCQHMCPTLQDMSAKQCITMLPMNGYIHRAVIQMTPQCNQWCSRTVGLKKPHVNPCKRAPGDSTYCKEKLENIARTMAVTCHYGRVRPTQPWWYCKLNINTTWYASTKASYTSTALNPSTGRLFPKEDKAQLALIKIKMTVSTHGSVASQRQLDHEPVFSSYTDSFIWVHHPLCMTITCINSYTKVPQHLLLPYKKKAYLKKKKKPMQPSPLAGKS